MKSNELKRRTDPEKRLALGLMPGDKVRVRSYSEIFKTLDGDGTSEGLPFMPEMLKHCGMNFIVLQRADKTCALSSEMQRLQGVVTLADNRCDGVAHGGCQLNCMIFWKEAWLKRSEPRKLDNDQSILGSETVIQLRTMRGPAIYVCQATELTRASIGDLSKWTPMQYVRDMRSRTFTPLQFVRAVVLLIVEKIAGITIYRGAESRLVHTSPQPREVLNLQVGDIVEVKSKREILTCLNDRRAFRGLGFTTDMFACSGRRYRVKERIDRIIHETTGEMRVLKNTVMLEGAACERHRGCARRMYFLWREIWLRKV